MSDKERMERVKRNNTDMIFFSRVFWEVWTATNFHSFFIIPLRFWKILIFYPFFSLVYCSLDPTRLLLTFGACTTTQDKLHGNTALHWAILAQNHTAVSTLVMHGASLDIANAQVRTILYITQTFIPLIGDCLPILNYRNKYGQFMCI